MQPACEVKIRTGLQLHKVRPPCFFLTIIRLQVKGLLHNLTIPDVEARLLDDMGYFD